ncbi:hypothetical protein BB31_39610 [Amycolatopsis lurida NRRL 2430]|uniref:Uncharacterized protein n=1 Tax=Amycolatopsis lurida NRRL 2430 TaxID=1460371 RepID=A0A2P2FGE9_AMYLU|nr:hypothetical protein BB31_39610 [Amycolatopsis lurida NRRL 2430]
MEAPGTVRLRPGRFDQARRVGVREHDVVEIGRGMDDARDRRLPPANARQQCGDLIPVGHIGLLDPDLHTSAGQFNDRALRLLRPHTVPADEREVTGTPVRQQPGHRPPQPAEAASDEVGRITPDRRLR